MTGFNNRWDHEGETADESREGKGEVDPQPPTCIGGETLGVRRVNLTSHAREKRGKCNKKHGQETSLCWLLHHPFPPGSQSMISQ